MSYNMVEGRESTLKPTSGTRFSDIWNGWLEIMHQKARKFEDGVFLIEYIVKEADPVVHRIVSRLDTLNDESISNFFKIIAGYDSDIRRMSESSRTDRDFQSTLFCCLNTLDRLIKVIDRLLDIQFKPLKQFRLN